ncbi:hypothetical protein I316_07590 [Kwoniella heveanensis BCC8398]|uniref:Hcy-binding domain-containing protein n=1 Tax=Kwoniella heveanensis BCC8398 TaxID=1296120 RepID=A0A1B9GI83_9TREE|nr:hypothetical protein I316_07590 [Kwoniella heveanensis BCC8398]
MTTEQEHVILLDGGMGTTLESRGYDVSTALWGSDLLVTDPAAVQDVHQGYLEAGSDLIQTATYPLTPDNVAEFLANADGSKECHLGRAWSVLHTSVKIVSDLIEGSEDDNDGDNDESVQNNNNNNDRNRRHRGVVLSCGPFGATLKPGQEYAGVYPPPFGPGNGTNRFPFGSSAASAHPETSCSSLSSAAAAETGNLPASASKAESEAVGDGEGVAVTQLTEWYLNKLRVFAFAPSPSVYGHEHGPVSESKHTARSAWTDIDWIAFETIPLLCEIKAIRRAMTALRAELARKYGVAPHAGGGGGGVGGGGGGGGGEGIREGEAGAKANTRGKIARDRSRPWWDKKFWITSAYPNGLHPQTINTDGSGRRNGASVDSGPGPAHASIPQVVEALLGSSTSITRNSEINPAGDETDELAIPDGVGINCTHPQYLPRLASELTKAYEVIQQSQRSRSVSTTSDQKEDQKKVRFVVYPDGGQVYDVDTRSWKEENTPRSAEEWAERVMETVRMVNGATMGQGDKEGFKGAGIDSSHSSVADEKVWGGVIVGGCCKTTCNEIRALRKLIDRDLNIDR